MLTPPASKRASAPAVSVAIEDPHTMATSRPSPQPLHAASDDESRLWLKRLSSDGAELDRARSDLRELLLRAARYEVHRRDGGTHSLGAGDHDDLAQQAADDALMAITAKLGDFRGEARFTTWAYKFALLEAAVKVRRRAWQGREIQLETEHWDLIADHSASPGLDAETRELMAAVWEAIEHALTPHQRQILVAITLNDVPIDVLSERLNSTRGALYKTLHDARGKLRAHLSEQGFDIGQTAESRTS
jgi:RNA polymerase sigma-70 factor, ECF subfamily